MNQLVISRSRLPMPSELVDDEIDARKWRVLCESIFPSARSSEAVLMAIDYCRARSLDIFKKPIHIVPMWNSTLQKEVETCWPGINEVQITAARTGAWAGMDEPHWGDDVVGVTFKGRKKDKKKGWIDAEVCLTYPEWCAVTVYRVVGGIRCAFTEPVYWQEAYSRAGGSDLPTDMWVKRPRGQLHKVAKAASLRAAFPEEGEYTAEEMEGKDIEAGGVVIEHEPPVRRSSAAAKRNGDWDKFNADLLDCGSVVSLARLRDDYTANVYPTWNKDWQDQADEAFEKRQAELTAEHLSDTLEDSLDSDPPAESAGQDMNFKEARDWLVGATSLADLKSRATNNGYVEALKDLNEAQTATLRNLYAERVRFFKASPVEAG